MGLSYLFYGIVIPFLRDRENEKRYFAEKLQDGKPKYKNIRFLNRFGENVMNKYL